MLVEEIGRKKLAIEHGLHPEDLKYIGSTDCSFIAEGALLLQYNVMLKTHNKYKSTIGYKYKWPKENGMKVKASAAVMITVLGYGTKPVMDGCQNLCRTTGAKVYYRGGGWWQVCGSSNTDGPKTIGLVNKIKESI